MYSLFDNARRGFVKQRLIFTKYKQAIKFHLRIPGRNKIKIVYTFDKKYLINNASNVLAQIIDVHTPLTKLRDSGVALEYLHRISYNYPKFKFGI